MIGSRMRNCAAGAGLALSSLASWLCGCASASRATFPAIGPSIVWPRPPDSPRIRYIGELIGEASLGRAPTGGEVLRSVLEGPREQVRFVGPAAVAVAGQRVYVADPSHPSGPLVHVLDLNARSYSAIREAGGAPLRWPIDVVASAGTLAIADAMRAAVFVLDSQGRTLRTIGEGKLKRPVSIAWARGASDELWILDAGASSVLVFDGGGVQRNQFGGRGVDLGRFNFPAGLAAFSPPPVTSAPAFRAAIADSMNFRVQLLDSGGAPLRAFGRKGDAAGDFSLPRDVAIDSEGHIYVLDNQFENVQIFDADGRLLLALGGEGAGPGQFSLPSGITIDDEDRIWVADTFNRRVQAFQYMREKAP
jgi:DNA-binding beta-propeller fold protein YncE